MYNVDDLGVARIGAILLEGETQDRDLGIFNGNVRRNQLFDDVLGDVFSHIVVDAST